MNNHAFKDDYDCGTLASSGNHNYMDFKSNRPLERSEACDDVFTKSRKYPVFALNIDGEQKELEQPIILHLRLENGYWFAEHEGLDIAGVGDTIREAHEDAVNDLAYLWSYYAALNDDEVMASAKIYKEKFSNIF